MNTTIFVICFIGATISIFARIRKRVEINRDKNKDKVHFIVLLAVFVVFLLTFPMIGNINCSKSIDMCTIYNSNFIGFKMFHKQFKISDIIDYNVKEHHTSKSYWKSYRLELYLKNGEKISMPCDTRSIQKSENMYYNIKNKESYVIKGDLIRSIFDSY